METGYFGADRSQRMARERVQAKWMDAYAPVRHLDPVLVVAALILSLIGIGMVYSAKAHQLELQQSPTDLYATRQMIALAVGTVALVLTATFDYRYFRAYAIAVYAVAVVGLILVLTPLGVEVNGSRAWLSFGGFQLQPSEFAKVAVIVSLAALLHERRETPGILTVLLGAVIVAIPLLLILEQPDPGTASVFVWIAFALFLVGNIQVRYLLAMVVAGIGGAWATLKFELLAKHQIDRLTAFLDPNNPDLSQSIRYNADQSLIAIGSGQFFGKGYMQGTQTNLAYVPENHTDFIFTVVGEEFGFVGALVVLGLFGLLMWRGIRIAMMSKDLFGTLLAAGAVALIAFQVFVNVGMAVGIMPVIGIPLPFVSYGGTSLIAGFVLVGLMLNVHMRRF